MNGYSLGILNPFVHRPEVRVLERNIEVIDKTRHERQLLGRPDWAANSCMIPRRCLTPGIDIFERFGEIKFFESIMENNLKTGARKLEHVSRGQFGGILEDVVLQGGVIPPIRRDRTDFSWHAKVLRIPSEVFNRKGDDSALTFGLGDRNRYIKMSRILVATRNLHKVREIKGILGGEHQWFTLRDLKDVPEVIEDAATFEGNATKKAVELARWVESKIAVDYVLADDSGLEVDALNGAPGVHSARFAALDSGAAGNSPDAENNAKLLGLLRDVPPEKRTGRFRCVIALTPILDAKEESASKVCEADEHELATQLFSGACEGKILSAPRGTHGFGYDPLFVPKGFEETFAELGDETKNKISHRACALEKLKRIFAARTT
jgi:XTP/dITP diphosphohydrolase